MPAAIFAAVWKGFPFSTVVYLAALQNVDQEQIEAATIDGAGPFRRPVRRRAARPCATSIGDQPAADDDPHLQLLRHDLGADPRRPAERHRRSSRPRSTSSASASSASARPPPTACSRSWCWSLLHRALFRWCGAPAQRRMSMSDAGSSRQGASCLTLLQLVLGVVVLLPFFWMSQRLAEARRPSPSPSRPGSGPSTRRWTTTSRLPARVPPVLPQQRDRLAATLAITIPLALLAAYSFARCQMRLLSRLPRRGHRGADVPGRAPSSSRSTRW